jgi:tRNA 2-selenouridine synthase SelU
MALSEASRVIAAHNLNVATATKHLELAQKNLEASLALEERSKEAFNKAKAVYEADSRAVGLARQGARLEDAKKHQQEDTSTTRRL